MNNEFNLSLKDKIEDYNYLYEILSENYPYMHVNQRINNISWLDNKNMYIDKLKKINNNFEYYYVINDIIEDLRNHHTYLINPKLFMQLKSAYNIDKSDNNPWKNIFNNEKALISYEYWDNIIINKIGIEELNSKYLLNVDSMLDTKIIEENNIAYLKVRSFWHENIEKDRVKIQDFLSKVKDYSNLIIDIRGNMGGAEEYWISNIVGPLLNKELSVTYHVAYRGGEYSKQFINYRLENRKLIAIEEFPRTKNNPPELFIDFGYGVTLSKTLKPINTEGFRGKIYILIDEYVYSASEAFANFVKASKWATLVGKTTSGDGIGFDPAVLMLPNSGLLISFSLDMGLNPDGSSNEEMRTAPDININDNEDSLKKVLEIIRLKM